MPFKPSRCTFWTWQALWTDHRCMYRARTPGSHEHEHELEVPRTTLGNPPSTTTKYVRLSPQFMWRSLDHSEPYFIELGTITRPWRKPVVLQIRVLPTLHWSSRWNSLLTHVAILIISSVDGYELAFPLDFKLNTYQLKGSTVEGKGALWFSSSTSTNIPSPPVVNPQVGDLWQHTNSSQGSRCYWLYQSKPQSKPPGWHAITLGEKVKHPVLDRYLREVNDVPQWVVRSTWQKWVDSRSIWLYCCTGCTLMYMYKMNEMTLIWLELIWYRS